MDPSWEGNSLKKTKKNTKESASQDQKTESFILRVASGCLSKKSRPEKAIAERTEDDPACFQIFSDASYIIIYYIHPP